MGTNLLQALHVFTKLIVQTVGEKLVVGAINDILLSVKEPFGDLVLEGVLDDGDNALELIVGEFTCS